MQRIHLKNRQSPKYSSTYIPSLEDKNRVGDAMRSLIASERCKSILYRWKTWKASFRHYSKTDLLWNPLVQEFEFRHHFKNPWPDGRTDDSYLYSVPEFYKKVLKTP